ncbi:hypothetical protein BELL_0951g00060 [Botrytis elliptica]|uniref:Uncharacterized protein n=1 Tax=Botrytis elliptica TaxID=278938 RepID=A0A4Z1JC54_9HELO|nr:hypothetical protein BELL_0951g00060 [Botrytis elliptica]
MNLCGCLNSGIIVNSPSSPRRFDRGTTIAVGGCSNAGLNPSLGVVSGRTEAGIVDWLNDSISSLDSTSWVAVVFGS